MPESLQTVFLLVDKPIVNFDPEELKEHPLNREIFGDLLQEEYNALKEDIKERGIQDPLHVVKREGSYIIVSGHQRAKIAKELGIKVPCIIRDDLKDELQIKEYLIKDNLLRRHLTTAQKAEIVLALAEIEAERARVRQEATQLVGRGVQKKDVMVVGQEPPTINEDKGKSIEIAVKKAKDQGLPISDKTVKKAKKILEAAEKDQDIKKEWEKAKAGRTTVEKVYREVKQKERREALNKPEPLEKITKEYDIIYADPPWRYEFSQSRNREIENQYPTMTLEEICGLEIPAASDAVLFLWCPMPKLDWGLKVIEAWGFKYRTGFVWVKDKIGMGHYVRSKHELLLIGIKGSPGTPLPENRPESVIFAPRFEHSKKPDIVYGIIEKMYPGKSYFEMFARKTREGWGVWGNEV